MAAPAATKRSTSRAPCSALPARGSADGDTPPGAASSTVVGAANSTPPQRTAPKPDAGRPRMAGVVAAEPSPALLGLPVSGFGAVRWGGVEFAAPTEAEEAAPGGVSPGADPRAGSAEHGARLVERLVSAGAAMVVHLRGENVA